LVYALEKTTHKRFHSLPKMAQIALKVALDALKVALAVLGG
jgi:hypothetical protein